MLRISKMTDYATVVMTHLARDPERRISARELADELGIGEPTVSKLLKQLERCGLLDAQRGKHGGYRLARPPASISVAEVIRAIEGPIALTECASEAQACDQEPLCSLQDNWQRINRAVLQALAQVSLTEMISPLSEAGVQTKMLEFYRSPRDGAALETE